MPLNPATAGIIQTGVQGGFSIGGNLFSAREAEKANKRNVSLYRENRGWEEYMSNTAWQRGVQDMLAAGINPMVAFNQGGASTPTTSAPTVQPVAEWSGAINSAAKASNILAIQQQAANIELTRAQAKEAESKATSAAGVAKYAEESAMLDNMLKGEQWANMKRQYDLTDAQVKQIEQMLPALLAASKAQTAVAEQAVSSSKQQQELDKYKFPEAQVTAEWFSSFIGGGSRVTNAIQDILRTIMMLRGK